MSTKYFIIISFFLFFPFFNSKAVDSVLYEDFENYNTGDVVGQYDWLQASNYVSAQISSSYGHLSSKSLCLNGTATNGAKKLGNTITAPFSFDMWIMRGDSYSGRMYLSNSSFVNQIILFSNTALGAWCPNSYEWYKLTFSCSSDNYFSTYVNNSLISSVVNDLCSTADLSSLNFYQNSSGASLICIDDINDSIPPVLSILDPIDNQFIPVGDYLFSGTCPYNGTNMLYLSDGFYYQNPSDPSNYTIPCVDHMWSATSTIYDGSREKLIYETDYLIDGANTATVQDVSFTGINENYTYSLSISYPDALSNNYYLLALSNVFPFRFNYTTASQNEVFALANCNSDYSSCSAFVNNTFTILDEDGNGYVDTTLTSSTTMQYYQASISQDSVVKYSLKFRVMGSDSDEVQQPVAPDDHGWLGNIFANLFIPKQSTLRLFTSDLPAVIQSKVPFAYFYYIKDKFDSYSLSTSTIPAIIIPLKIGDTATITMPIVNFSEPVSAGILDDFRPFIVAFLWFGFGIWIIERITNLNL